MNLTTKLTLAFILTGLVGAALVVLLSTQATRQEFDRFVVSQGSEQIGASLTAYYVANDGWGERGTLPFGNPRWGRFMLLDADGSAITRQGGGSDPGLFENRLELELEGEFIGTLLTGFDETQANPRSWFDFRSGGNGSEAQFRNNVLQSSLWSAAIATGVALVVGVLLSRGLTRPIRALTDASQRMADGELGMQVDVPRDDEIGRLAAAFNLMSSELADASQKRKQLTADIAHDLRTPLSILRGYMEGLKDGSLESTPKLNAIMYEEVEHLEHLVKDLRTLSLADAGELQLNRRSVAPRSLLERTGLAYVMQAEQRGLALRIETSATLPPLHVDLERMTQVLNNLVSNALRFTQEGEVVLGASAENGQMSLSVSDTGLGIKADALPHVFDRFYRADESRQRQQDGATSSGLGLAIAKAIVLAHGGKIGVQSISAENDTAQSGTTFTITLPLTN